MKIKRSLSIIIPCLIMTLSFMCSAVLAEGFSDADKIGAAYSEAVDEMAEAGVLEGYPDGSFRPEATLSREEGAKIITYLCLGKPEAETLVCDKAPFDDVPAERWSAPYIAWCAEHEILHGYGNGNFGPTDTLTGDQYAKMLLCALGLARNVQLYIGPDWYKAVREDAKAAKLYEGDPSMESSAPVTRMQAALLSRNTVKAEKEKNASGGDAENPASSAEHAGSASAPGGGGGSSSSRPSGGSGSASSTDGGTPESEDGPESDTPADSETPGEEDGPESDTPADGETPDEEDGPESDTPADGETPDEEDGPESGTSEEEPGDYEKPHGHTNDDGDIFLPEVP